MAKKLFVGGLSWNTVDASLRAAFDKYGDVSDAKVIMDRETGRSRGFGFVTMPDDGAATQAIADMDGKAIDGRAVKVSEALERAPRPGGFGGGAREGGGGNRAGGDREYGSRDFGGGSGFGDGGARDFGGGGGARDFGGGARDFGGGGGGRGDRGRGRDRNGGGGGGGHDW